MEKVLADEAYEALGMDMRPQKVRSLQLIKTLFEDAELERAAGGMGYTGNCPESTPSKDHTRISSC